MESSSLSTVRRFLKDDSGVTAIEYAFIAAATSLALFIVMPTIGVNLADKFASVSVGLK